MTRRSDVVRFEIAALRLAALATTRWCWSMAFSSRARADCRRPPGEDGILKLPPKLRRDLLVLFLVKLAMLTALYLLFFSPSHRAGIDVLGHIITQ